MKNLLTKNLFFAVLLILSAMTLSACGNDQGSGGGAGAGTNGKDGKDDDTDEDNRPAATDADFKKLCETKVKCEKITETNAVRDCVIEMKDTLYGAKKCNVEAMECLKSIECKTSLSEEQKENEAVKCLKECSVLFNQPEGYTSKGTIAGSFCTGVTLQVMAYADRKISEKCTWTSYEERFNLGVEVSKVCEEKEVEEYFLCLPANADPQRGITKNTIAKCKDKINQQCMDKIESFVVPK